MQITFLMRLVLMLLDEQTIVIFDLYKPENAIILIRHEEVPTTESF